MTKETKQHEKTKDESDQMNDKNRAGKRDTKKSWIKDNIRARKRSSPKGSLCKWGVRLKGRSLGKQIKVSSFKRKKTGRVGRGLQKC